MFNNYIELKYLTNIDEDRKVLEEMSFTKNKRINVSMINKHIELSKEEIIMSLTTPDIYNLEFIEIILHTYQWYFSEVELFSYLLARFSMNCPIGLSENEKRKFDEKVRFNVRHKVLLFIKQWFNLYKDILFVVNEMHVLFQEIIYL